MSRHIVQGRIVAKARYFLEQHDKAEEANEILAEADGVILTGEMLRTLLDEHDAYRAEVAELRGTGGHPGLHGDIETLRTEAAAVWQDHRRKEADAWDAYHGDGAKPRQPWAKARELAALLGAVVGGIERVQRVADSAAAEIGVGADR